MKENIQKAFEEAIEAISDGFEEICETKKVVYDKKTFQYSIKIPKALALKANIYENSEFEILINPKEDTIRNIKSKIVIVKKEVKSGETEKGA